MLLNQQEINQTQSTVHQGRFNRTSTANRKSGAYILKYLIALLTGVWVNIGLVWFEEAHNP